MVLGKLSELGRSTTLDNSSTRPYALAVGAGGGSLDIFISSIFSLFFLLLWKMA